MTECKTNRPPDLPCAIDPDDLTPEDGVLLSLFRSQSTETDAVAAPRVVIIGNEGSLGVYRQFDPSDAEPDVPGPFRCENWFGHDATGVQEWFDALSDACSYAVNAWLRETSIVLAQTWEALPDEVD